MIKLEYTKLAVVEFDKITDEQKFKQQEGICDIEKIKMITHHHCILAKYIHVYWLERKHKHFLL